MTSTIFLIQSPPSAFVFSNDEVLSPPPTPRAKHPRYSAGLEEQSRANVPMFFPCSQSILGVDQHHQHSYAEFSIDETLLFDLLRNVPAPRLISLKPKYDNDHKRNRPNSSVKSSCYPSGGRQVQVSSSDEQVDFPSIPFHEFSDSITAIKDNCGNIRSIKELLRMAPPLPFSEKDCTINNSTDDAALSQYAVTPDATNHTSATGRGSHASSLTSSSSSAATTVSAPQGKKMSSFHRGGIIGGCPKRLNRRNSMGARCA